MKSQAEEVKQIAAQLLAGMLANPDLNRLYLAENGTLSPEQQERLIAMAIAMSESLINRAELSIESHFQRNFS